ncbi:MAG: glycosyltransferase [Chloroflexi bacterium]|nr:glycosyltransferase [Chloroflexota bacterium]
MEKHHRVVFYWEEQGIAVDHPRVNPYGGLLAKALAPHGIVMEPGWTLDPEWVRAQHGRVHVLHLNWIHRYYAGPDPDERQRRFKRFAAGLLLARRLDFRIVWTMHNLLPHEQHDPLLDIRARRLVCTLAHAVIVHCRRAGALLAERFGRRHDVHVIPHGHFIDVYPNTIGRTAARLALGIPEDVFAYLFFGNIRAYKGVERLLEVFGSLPDERLRLVIAGRLHPNYSGPLVSATEPLDPRVLFRPGEVGIEEMQVYFNAADAVVLPFVDTLTSGSAITALGFGRPIVVPAVGCLPELVAGRTCGVVYDPVAPDGLRRALHDVRSLDAAAAGAESRARAYELNWETLARQTIQAYGLEPRRAAC